MSRPEAPLAAPLTEEEWRQQLGLSEAAYGQMRRTSVQHVRQDSWDLSTGQTLMSGSRDWRRVAGQGAPWDALAQDAWATFYKAQPTLVPAGNVHEHYLPNRPVVERLQQDPATAQTRAATMLDETAAALAALAAMPELCKEVERERAEAERRAEQARQRAEHGLPAEGVPGAPDGAPVRAAVRRAAQAAAKATEEYAEVLGGWGLQPADLRLAPMPERLGAVGALVHDPRFRAMAALVGRMRNLARARQRQRLQRSADELHGIETGADLARILPSELGALNHPLLKLDLYRRLQEGQVLQYRLKTRPREGRGPMVILLDSSGSMDAKGPDGSTRMERAKAVALALVDTARRQRRAAAVAAFNGDIVFNAEFVPGQPLDVRQLVALASVQAAGGTSYDHPILWATAQVAESGPGGRPFRAADLVLLTDGECMLGAPILHRLQASRRALGLRVWSVLVGTDTLGSVRAFSDRLWRVPALGDDTAGELFEEVAQG